MEHADKAAVGRESGAYILVASCTVRFLIVNMLAIVRQNPATDTTRTWCQIQTCNVTDYLRVNAGGAEHGLREKNDSTSVALSAKTQNSVKFYGLGRVLILF